MESCLSPSPSSMTSSPVPPIRHAHPSGSTPVRAPGEVPFYGPNGLRKSTLAKTLLAIPNYGSVLGPVFFRGRTSPAPRPRAGPAGLFLGFQHPPEEFAGVNRPSTSSSCARPLGPQASTFPVLEVLLGSDGTGEAPLRLTRISMTAT